jgi:hypothetical protein
MHVKNSREKRTNREKFSTLFVLRAQQKEKCKWKCFSRNVHVLVPETAEFSSTLLFHRTILLEIKLVEIKVELLFFFH